MPYLGHKGAMLSGKLDNYILTVNFVCQLVNHVSPFYIGGMHHSK